MPQLRDHGPVLGHAFEMRDGIWNEPISSQGSAWELAARRNDPQGLELRLRGENCPHLFRERWHIGVVVGVDFDGLALGAKSRDLRFLDLLILILNVLGLLLPSLVRCAEGLRVPALLEELLVLSVGDIDDVLYISTVASSGTSSVMSEYFAMNFLTSFA